MKRLFSVMVLGLLLLAYGCGGGDSPKAVVEKMLNISENFAADMDKAGSADEVVKAIEKFSDDIKDIEADLKKIKEKYPNLSKGEMPEEFKEFEERFKKFGANMIGLGAKLGQYMRDENVMKAMKKMQDAMKALQ
jgi:DNA repair ATPase RecN